MRLTLAGKTLDVAEICANPSTREGSCSTWEQAATDTFEKDKFNAVWAVVVT